MRVPATATLADTGAALKPVSAGGIAGLKVRGIDRLDAADNKTSFDAVQARAQRCPLAGPALKT